jgi:AsmA protein
MTVVDLEWNRENFVKRSMKMVLGVVVTVILLLAAIPFLIKANTFRPMVETRLTEALGRKVTLGDLSLSLFSGNLVAKELSIAGDPQYSTTTFLKARELRIRVEMVPLIFSRRLEVRGLLIVAPEIHLVRGSNGAWNFSTIHPSAAAQTAIAKQSASFPELTVGLITVEDGRATVETLPTGGAPRVFEHLNFAVKDFSSSRQFPFSLSANLPGDAQVMATGNAGPIDRQDAATTPMEMHIVTKHLNPVAARLLGADAGLSLVADIEANTTSDGKTVSSNGKIHMENLVLRKGGKPTPHAIDLNYTMAQGLNETIGQLQDATLNTGNVAIHLIGTYEILTANPMLHLKVTGESLPIDELQALMNAAGVSLPHGAVLQGGTLSIAMAVNGLANALAIAGPVDARSTELVGFDIASKIHGIAALSGLKTGDTTAIEKLRFDLKITNAEIQVENIQAVLPAMGELNGSGTVSPANELDFKVTLNATTAQGIGKAGVSLLTKMNDSAGAGKKVAKGVPLLVGGTPSEPVITADVGGLLHRDKEAFLAHFGKKK